MGKLGLGLIKLTNANNNALKCLKTKSFQPFHDDDRYFCDFKNWICSLQDCINGNMFFTRFHELKKTYVYCISIQSHFYIIVFKAQREKLRRTFNKDLFKLFEKINWSLSIAGNFFSLREKCWEFCSKKEMIFHFFRLILFSLEFTFLTFFSFFPHNSRCFKYLLRHFKSQYDKRYLVWKFNFYRSDSSSMSITFHTQNCPWIEH